MPRAVSLRNPINDVELLAKVFTSSVEEDGVVVILVRDGTKAQMDEAVESFLAKLGPGVVAIFGFAGCARPCR